MLEIDSYGFSFEFVRTNILINVHIKEMFNIKNNKITNNY